MSDPAEPNAEAEELRYRVYLSPTHGAAVVCVRDTDACQRPPSVWLSDELSFGSRAEAWLASTKAQSIGEILGAPKDGGSL